MIYRHTNLKKQDKVIKKLKTDDKADDKENRFISKKGLKDI